MESSTAEGVRPRPDERPSRGRRAAFLLTAVLGVPITTLAWLWLHLASLEEATEQGKAVAAGTTMAGTTLLLGVVPLVVVHVVLLLVLQATRRPASARSAFIALAAVSTIGLVVVMLLTHGQLIVSPAYRP